MRACNKCGITLRGSDQEGDICLTCLSSLTPHCNFDQGYSTIEGCIRQSTKQPIEKPKPMKITTLHLTAYFFDHFEIFDGWLEDTDLLNYIQKWCEDNQVDYNDEDNGWTKSIKHTETRNDLL